MVLYQHLFFTRNYFQVDMINRAHRITGVSLTRAKGAKDSRVLLLGLDWCGKTTLLYKLKLAERITTIPTIGFNVETIETPTGTVTMWDVGGQDKIRALWRHYVSSTQAVLWLVDASDPSRFGESARELSKLFAENAEELQNVRLVVVAAKQDLPGAATAAETWSAMQAAAGGSLAGVRPNAVLGYSCDEVDFSSLFDGLLGIEQAAAKAACRTDDWVESLPSILSRFIHGQLEYVQSRALNEALEQRHDRDRAEVEPSEDFLATPVLSGVLFSTDLFGHVLSYLPLSDLLPYAPSFLFGSDSLACAVAGAALFVSKSMAWCVLHAAAKSILGSLYQNLDKTCRSADQKAALAGVDDVLRTAMYLALPPVLWRVHARLCAVLLYRMVYAPTDNKRLTELLRPGGGLGSLFPAFRDHRDKEYSLVLPLAAFLFYTDADELSVWPKDNTFVHRMLSASIGEPGSETVTLHYAMIARLQAAAQEGISLVLENDADPGKHVIDADAVKGMELELEVIERNLIITPSVFGVSMIALVESGKYCKLTVHDEPHEGILIVSMGAIIAVANVLTGKTPSYCREFAFEFCAGLTRTVSELLRWAISRAAPQVARIVVSMDSDSNEDSLLTAADAERFKSSKLKAGSAVSYVWESCSTDQC
jgi:small GTP-binding protein